MSLFNDKLPPELFPDEAVDELKNDGFEGADGLLDDPDDLVAIAVGNTHDGESFPANPNLVRPVPLSLLVSISKSHW
ncbi:hypothetical protein OGAPHI_004643 [Ogataea philodendri]|uniref:Uncharacterized protein n=1 Tax=Ogataea philodendri TaxID=1378263 RepID=A0A9P8T333_9ASCO|nr:uncharacterized protein OGAPHI_004643 [Ogataea philodendri]KAH3664291.1 hypothetical protein OGAPHI_004643 [Ogataea philodendri]